MQCVFPYLQNFTIFRGNCAKYVMEDFSLGQEAIKLRLIFPETLYSTFLRWQRFSNKIRTLSQTLCTFAI